MEHSFDINYYLTIHNDLIANGVTEHTALDHYNKFGKYENRIADH